MMKAEIERLVNHYQKQINFLESYYADKLKAKDFKIRIEPHANTSYYNAHSNTVIIAHANLEMTMSENHTIRYKAFYSILLHEIGHALYTGDLPYSVTANVLEDNRLENLIQRWNGRTDFTLMRYAFQDKVLTLERLKQLVDSCDPEKLRDPLVAEGTAIYKYASLALLRTVNNKPYVDYLAKDIRNINLLSALFAKHKEYINNDRPSDGIYTKVYLMSGNTTYDFKKHTQRLVSILSDIRSILCVLLINMIDTTKQQQQQQQQQQHQKQNNQDEENESENDKSNKSDDNDNEPIENGSNGIETKSVKTEDDTDSEDETSDEPEDTEDTEDESEPEDTEDTEDAEDTEDTEDESDTEDTEDADNESDTEDTEDETEEKDDEFKTGLTEQQVEQLERLENELQNALYSNAQTQKETKDTIGRLTNTSTDTEDYKRINLTAFTTLRRTGIKGNGTLPTNSGSVKQLNMRKYARRDFVKVPEKYFDKRTNAIKGGSNPKIMFYLDISSSMDNGSRLKTALDYMRNFYDKLHQSVDIRMFAFGTFSYELSRQELNYDFMRSKVENSTEPKWIEPLKDEEVIIITDGGWHKEYLREEWKRKAHVIVIDTNVQQIRDFSRNPKAANFMEIKNLHIVSTENMVRELEKATSVINEKIKRR